MAERPALDRDATLGDRPDAAQRLQQLRLAVAGDARDADDLAAADLEADALHAGDAGARRAPRGARPRESARPASPAPSRPAAGPCGRPSARPAPRSRSAAVRRCATIAPWRMTETLSVTAMISRSLWVISTTVRPWSRRLRRMRNRWSASCGVSTPVGSSRISTCAPRNSALRISTRCWMPTGRSRTTASRSTSRAYSRSSLAISARARARARRERGPAFGAEQQVLQHRERLDQHEVLVDHADAGCDRVLGALDPAFLAGDPDAAAIGLIEAVEDVHQGRLAGAVLADDAVDRAGRDAAGRRPCWRGPGRSACRSRSARPPAAVRRRPRLQARRLGHATGDRHSVE